MQYTYNAAEPGVLLMDRINAENDLRDDSEEVREFTAENSLSNNMLVILDQEGYLINPMSIRQTTVVSVAVSKTSVQRVKSFRCTPEPPRYVITCVIFVLSAHIWEPADKTVCEYQ